MNRINPRIPIALGALAFVYFVIYPEDAKAVVAPITSVVELSQTVSPWLYMVVAVGIVTWGMLRSVGTAEFRLKAGLQRRP